jgi:hypothetical protein
MFRFLLRVLGLLLMAAGFVGLVIDGTRSIANSQVVLTPIGEMAFSLFPRSFPLLEPAVARIHPYLWDPIVRTLLLLPASVVGFAVGILLLWLGRRPPEPIGYRADS